MSSPSFWDDTETSRKTVSELKELTGALKNWESIDKEISAAGELIPLIEEDPSLSEEVEKEIDKLSAKIDKFQLKLFLSGRFDRENAIVSINSGAGGTEACDWAGMLFRMYTRWAESNNYSWELADIVNGEEAGIKSVTFIIKGLYAYGYIKTEKGVHRLVRISPFDANKRRHTSFASVDVIPEVSSMIKIDIKPEELRIDTFHSSGAGGQHVNVTDSAVRITHLPTGIVVSCQSQRSQYQNKHTALNILKSKLYQRAEEENRRQMEKVFGDKKKIEWGSQVRSYILHPYLMVKDHRTNYQVSNAQAVLDGDIGRFMEESLIHLRRKD